MDAYKPQTYVIEPNWSSMQKLVSHYFSYILTSYIFSSIFLCLLPKNKLYIQPNVMKGNEYFTVPNCETETVAIDPPQTCSTPRKKKKSSNNNMNKRRFSDEQIKSLETIFYSTESKLDSRQKVELATELGLQPRQIAIWFQNRRARRKSKEMQNNFRSLRAKYDNLASQFKTLQEENNSLLSQLQKLSVLLQGPCEGYHSNDIAKTTYETHEKPKTLPHELEQYLNNNYNTNKKCVVNGEGERGLQMNHLLEGRSGGMCHIEKQVSNPNGSFETSETWCGFDSDDSVYEYQSCSSLQGLSFWG